MGCVEATCPGKTGAMSASGLQLARLLDLTLRNGDAAILAGTLKDEGLRTGAADSFETFEELLQAFLRQGRHFIEQIVRGSNLRDDLHAELLPTPMISAFMDGCLSSEKDITQGGATYDLSGISMINSIAQRGGCPTRDPNPRLRRGAPLPERVAERRRPGLRGPRGHPGRGAGGTGQVGQRRPRHRCPGGPDHQRALRRVAGPAPSRASTPAIFTVATPKTSPRFWTRWASRARIVGYSDGGEVAILLPIHPARSGALGGGVGRGRFVYA